MLPLILEDCCYIDVCCVKRSEHCVFLFFQLSSIVFLALVKATVRGILISLGLAFSSSKFPSMQTEGDNGTLWPRTLGRVVFICY